jgi:AmmeMemoRadiSam system protein B
MNVRKPAVAGQFYEIEPASLKEQIRTCFEGPLGPGKIPTIPGPESANRSSYLFILPHAGYMYSGQIAAHGYYEAAELINQKRTIAIVLGPNHYGIGSGVSTVLDFEWETPLGKVRVNDEIASFLMKDSRLIDIDASSMANEHSIEVHVPFLQFLFGGRLEIVPICMRMQDIQTAKELADSILKILNDWEGSQKIIVIGSSDLTHYETHDYASKVDLNFLKSGALVPSLKMHYTFLEKLDVSACGYGPMGVVIRLAEVSHRTPKLLKYSTSGDVTGDKSSVVGYAAVSYS